jgi:S-adenosylmethionine decarboxylase proenzyme
MVGRRPDAASLLDNAGKVLKKIE